MRKTGGKVMVFIASIFLGLLIALNMNLSNFENILDLSAKEYQSAIEERSDLYKQVSSLNQGNIELQKNINEYKYDDKKQGKILESMKAQIKDFGMVTGTTPVEGPGILLKISDGDINNSDNSSYETWKKIFHDNDMALVLNELRKAGAEAISINNRRILPNTGVICDWAFLKFGPNSSEYAPFYIYAIGDPDSLETALLSDESHIRQLITRELSVEIEKKEKIVMPATTNSSIPKFMKEYTKE